MISRAAFERVLTEIDAKDFTSYIYQYPPLAVWPRCTDPATVGNAWQQVKADRVGLYVHVPFCRTKCTFCCCFVIESDSKDDREKFLDALEKEAALWEPYCSQHRFSTLYVGGGTPSILDPSQLSRMFSIICNHFRLSQDSQICFEANPEFLDPARMSVLREAKVDRLTIGVQTLDNELTRGIERTQTNSNVRAVYDLARKVSIPYINVDLMVGLPGQSMASFAETLMEVARWRPDMMHLNSFKSTPFTRFQQRGGSLDMAAHLRTRAMEELSQQYLKRLGYRPIAFDAMGLSDKARNRQLEDSVIRNLPFLGLGPGAVSGAPGFVRHVNIPNLGSYCRTTAEGRLPIALACPLSPEQDQINFILNNLNYGAVSVPLFRELFGIKITAVYGKQLYRLEKKGLIRHDRSADQWILKDRSPEIIIEAKRMFYNSRMAENVLTHNLEKVVVESA